MRNFDKAAVVEEELQDLKLRFELLEGDRKAYYETSQWSMRQNKDDIGRLRVRNKELSEELSLIKKYDVDQDMSKNPSAMSPLEKLDQRICDSHKRFDELYSQLKGKDARLRDLEDQLDLLKKEEAILKADEKELEGTKEISVLENRLDKAMIKYNEAQSIKKTYEQVIKLLQEERVRFDNQLQAFEKALKAKKQDVLELEVMSRDANHAKDVAKVELAKFEAQVNEERKQRDKEIQELKDLIKQKRQIDEKADKKQMIQPEELLLPMEAKKEQFDEAKEKKLAEYDETMRIIKETTGVSDIDEVIQKFKNQSATNKHLLQLQEQNEAKFDELKKKRTDIVSKYEDLKLNSDAKNAHAKRMIQEFEKHLETATAKYQEAKDRFERAAKTLADGRSGIQHLSDKLEGIQLAEKPPKLPMSDDNIMRILDICTQKMAILYDTIRAKESTEGELPLPPTTITQAVLPSHNVRVKLQQAQFEADDYDDDDNDDDNEIPDRETLKRYTAQMLSARLKAKQPKKTKKKNTKKDDEDSS